MTICHLTHYDLDAVVSSLLADKIYNFDYSKCQGYPKVNASIEYLKSQGNDLLVVTDLCLEPDQLYDVMQHFDKVVYYDHHKGSEDFQDLNLPGFEKHISMDMSASALVFLDMQNRFQDKITKPLRQLAMYTDVYDMWRTDSPHWDIGYNLNELFWRYHYFDFMKRFKDGFDGFTDEETTWLKEQMTSKVKRIEEIEKEDVGNNSIFYVLENQADKTLINEFSLRKPGYDVYFMASYQDEVWRFSARIRNDGPKNADLNAVITELRDSDFNNGKICSCGGHEKAAAIEFNRGVSLDEAFQFAEQVALKIEEGK